MAHPRAIVDLLHDLLNEGEALADGFRQVAEINEHFVAGDQYGGVTYKDSQTVIRRDEWFDEEGVPRVHVNILGNLVATIVSLLTKNRPCAVARALNDEDPEDIYRSETTNTVIRFLSQELKTVEVIQKALKLAITDGSAGIKSWFDPEQNKVAIAPVSIFNVTIDPASEVIEDAQWFVFHRWLRPAEAEKEIARAGIKKKPKPAEYKTASGIKKMGVRAYEVWLRPGANEDYPQGLYSFVVDDVVIEQKPYPHIVKTDAGKESLPPLVWITARAVDEVIYGRTSVTDCVPLQRTLNECTARTVKYLRLNSSPKFRHPSTLPEGADPYADAKIEFPLNDLGIKAAEVMGWLPGPPIPQEVFSFIDWLIKQMHDVLGVAPLTAGTQTRNVSGKALDEVEGLDQQKNSQTTRSLETAVLSLYRGLLALVQRFYDDGRKLQIVGGSRAEVMLFNGADIMGEDIRLEPASEFDLMQPTQEQAAAEKFTAGIGSPADVRSAARDPRSAYSRSLAERLVADMLSGKDIELGSDDIDADAFKAVIAKHKHLAMLEGRKSDYLALVDLEHFVDDLAMQAHDTAAPPQQQPQGAAPAAAPQPEGAIQ